MMEGVAEEIHNDNEWLSTRNKRKITPERKVKKTHSRAFKHKKSTLDIKLTQNSPPPPELFLQTKQSDIMSFFNHKNRAIENTENHDRGGLEIINCDSDGSEDVDTQDKIPVLNNLENCDPKIMPNEEEGCDLPDLRQNSLTYSRISSSDFENGSKSPSQSSALMDSEFNSDMCRQSERRGIKRKISEENFDVESDCDVTKKRPIIDTQTAALELENFSCSENSDSLSENSQRVFPSHRKRLIDSEEAAWELQNFSVDTENLSQYVYK